MWLDFDMPPILHETDQIKLLEGGFVVIDDAFDSQSLREELEAENVRERISPAKVTSQIFNETIRGDLSTFLDIENSTKPRALKALVDWVASIGEQMFATKCRPSVQVACFPAGAAYPRHSDVSSKTNHQSRILTAILYLNDSWREQDGGCLRIFLKGADVTTDVEPMANRLVLFPSDLQHQVLETNRERWAVTVWLHRLQPPPLSITLQPGSSASCTATIFVSIAAYRDPETIPTMEHLFTQARFPNRVFVGLVLQLSESDNFELPTETDWWSRVDCVIKDASESAGPCPARSQCQMLYQDQDYFMQIDAHMRFRGNWDCFLIQELAKCPGSNPILSTYPVDYSPPNTMSTETKPTLLSPSHFGPEGMLRQSSHLATFDEPQWTGLLAAGFWFGPGRVVHEVPYPSFKHLFFGEEISLAVSLYTNGYDVYAPTATVCNHLWTRTTSHPRVNEDERRESLRIVRQQTLGIGTGSLRPVHEFAERIGVDFSKQRVTQGSTRAVGFNDLLDCQRATSLISSFM